MNADHLLLKANVSTNILVGAWKGVLVPFDVTRKLLIDKDGEVVGSDGSSDEKKAEVYQKLEDPAGSVRSDSVEVP